jgi:L-arabinose isomerase
VPINSVFDFAHMLGVECVVIDGATEFRSFQNGLRQSDAAYGPVDA